jgi:extracellular elastinolytic metalloproteinase
MPRTRKCWALGQEDYVVKDFWGDGPAPDAAERTRALFDRHVARGLASPAPPVDGASYRVFAHPKESPNDGTRTLVVDPADPTASPFGWHDTDGVAGAEFFVTRGNNVHAYTDIDANNVADPDSDPNGGASLTFDFTLDLGQSADTYRPAAVTNLFYWNNIVHDVFYQYGFNEASGNFQVNNYTNGGLGNDDVRAEAQDGSGTNNANFGTPVDGMRPRMQMFIWAHPQPNDVVVNGGPAAGTYEASRATFGPQLGTTGPITANVALVNDGVVGVPVPPAPPGTVNDGCEPFIGFPAGSIALLDRGFCTFVVKVANAQAAGAVAVIVANNAPGDPGTMGFTPPIPVITIPAVMVSLDNGTLFKSNLPFNATLRLNPTRSITRDSDLDAGVIAHEYGHGISNRLTGGPANVSCLNNAEQMGEGWSDWLAMAITAKPGDTRAIPRGIGTYVIFEPSSGEGIRPTQYSSDKTINPSTYASVADTANISQPHGIGYVWATMLWDMYWNLAEKHGYNPNVYESSTTGGNNLAIQLVMDGMKIQPCRPGFVDGRDAILVADQTLTTGANQCSIWRAFARRGLGFSASQGLSTSRTDGVEAFDVPPVCGFGEPVNLGGVTTWTAGSPVPLQFSLEGNEGLGILAAGYPVSQQIDCTTNAPIGGTEPTATPGSSRLTFDEETGQYLYLWKTKKSWEGPCREVIVKLTDGTEFRARFSFR